MSSASVLTAPEPGAPDHFIGKTILRRDANGAVRAYLARPFIGDPQRVRKFKAVARQHWGEWGVSAGQSPPSVELSQRVNLSQGPP